MTTYTVKQKPPKGHSLPPLLADVGAFVATQPHGALGWFDAFGAEAIPKEWSPKAAVRLNASGFAFLQLPDGSMLALLDTGDAKTPRAVVLLGSEGESRTVANSLEEFLVLWAKAETGVSELDDDEVVGRGKLAAWIEKRGLKVPKAKDFDFGAWLDGAAKASAPAVALAARQPTADYHALGPKMRELVDMMGRRADDPDLVTWVTTKLGKKAVAQTSHDSANVVAPKAGLELVFSHRVLNDKYPPIKKSARSFVPYLSHAWIRDKFGEKVFGLDPKGATEADITKAVGAPDGRRPRFMTDTKPEIAYWHRVADSGADVVVEIEVGKAMGIEVTLASARALEEFIDRSTCLFVAWAAEHGLLDETRFDQHRDLLGKLKTREALGSDLAKVALLRGLWDNHLRADHDLRRTAYQWFHNMNDLWITKDLKKVFGKRAGPHGHDQPILDDDGWDKVDKAANAFEKVFGAWLDR